RVDFSDPRKRLDRTVRAIGAPGDEPEDVLHLRTVGQGAAHALELFAGALLVASVEQRNAEIQTGDGQARVNLQRAAEGCRCGREVVLLEAGDADVVGAIRAFARGDGCRRLTGAGWSRRLCQEHESGGRGSGAQKKGERLASGGHREPVGLAPAPPSGGFATIPLPSSMVSATFASTPGSVSLLPSGHFTSIFVTLSAAPRPKVSGSSL